MTSDRTDGRHALVTVEQIEGRIVTVRGRRVMLDSDLAMLYGVATRVFNQAVMRNADRFPEDFSFVLEREEFHALMSQIVTSKSWGGRRKPPRMFTEHGAIMAATLLNSDQAVRMSVYVVRGFVKMRDALLGRAETERRLAQIEKTLLGHDTTLRDLYEKIRPLLLPPSAPPRRRIGFRKGDA